ncbi:MAG: PqqD family protein [Acidobacteriota bacterium]|jgi:hypothetical protein
MADEPEGGRFARRHDVVLRDVAGEHILVPIRSGVAELRAIFALNGTGVRIWELLDGVRTFDAVLAALTERYEVDAEVARTDLGVFIDRMLEAGLVERCG